MPMGCAPLPDPTLSMSRISLSNTGDWKLEFEDQDIRGFKVVDEDNNPIGTVDAMIVDTEQERVETIVLEDGTEYPAADISIGDGVVYLTTVETSGASDEPALAESGDVDETVRVYGDSGQVLRREEVESGEYEAHADAFRTHHASSYGDLGGAYEDLEPAYRYGFDTAHGDEYRNRSYVDAETDLRTSYGADHSDRDFDADRDAVRYGYTRAQHPTR